MGKKDFNFDVDFSDKYEDISSSNTNNNITSNAKKTDEFFKNMSTDNLYNFESDIKYHKRKHGLSKFISDKYYKTRKWWKCMKKGKRRAIKVLGSLFLVLVIAITWFFTYFDYNYREIDIDKLGAESKINKDIVNIALFGIDSRDTTGKTSFKGNSDSIMLLSVNTKSKKIKIISLMRDTLVPIDKNGTTVYNKINSAYSWGGPELAIKTLNSNFGLDITEYATVNFYGMSDIIDAVGGIDATLTKSEVTARGNNNHGINDMIQEICAYENLDPNDYYIKTEGEHHLNGIQAVAYARIRYCTNIWGTSNDYGRTDRQRYVMHELFDAAKNLPKSKYARLAKSLIPCTETSLSYSDILGLASTVFGGSPSFEEYRIPQNDSKMNFLMPSPQGSFGSVVYFDLAYASKVIHAIIYDDMTIESYVAEHPIEKNDWYASVSKGSGTKKSTTNDNTTSTTSSEVTDNTSSTESTVSEITSSETDVKEKDDDTGEKDDEKTGDDKNGDTSSTVSGDSSTTGGTEGEE